jgi:hypothetical protein
VLRQIFGSIIIGRPPAGQFSLAAWWSNWGAG